MAQRLGVWALAGEHQHVEPVLIAWAPAPEDPGPRHALHGPALLRADGLFPGTTSVGASGLHLHERDQAAAPHDQVEVVPPHSVAMGFDAPAPLDQPPASRDLGLPAVAVALVSPVGWGNTGGGHAGMMATVCDSGSSH